MQPLWKVKRKRAYLQQWRTCVLHRRALAGKLNAFQSKMKIMTLCHTFLRWKTRKAHKQRRQQLTHAAVQVLMHRSLSRIWQAWHHLAQVSALHLDGPWCKRSTYERSISD